jgi:uncharacterized protein involved in exopolysaccharide biosynthesis
MRMGQHLPYLLLILLTLVAGSGSALAQQPAAKEDADKKSSDTATQACPESDALRKNVQELNVVVQGLKRRVVELEKDRLATRLQEQLEREEQRGESLQLHLYEISEKEQPLLARMEQLNQQLRPETMERTLAGVGSVHPEDVRDEVRKKLLSERVRIQMQLELLRQDRGRTQASLATTDAAIQRLKQKLAEALRP